MVFNVGSRDEGQEKLFGIAHLLEHTVFLGSTRYTDNDFEKFIKETCCLFDAKTSKEVTLFNMTILDKYFVDGVDFLLNTTLYPSFPNVLFKQEKQVIKNEIDRHNSSIINVINDSIMATLFENHPIAHPVLGDYDTINNIPIEDVIRFHKQYYTTNNMTFFYSGNIEYGQIKALLLEKLKKSDVLPPKRITNYPSHLSAQKRLVNLKSTDVIDVAVFGYAPEYSNRRYIVFQLVKEILSSSIGNGILLKELREHNGLIYNIEMGYTSFTDAAIWDIRYKCRAYEAASLFGIILDILVNIQLYINSRDIDYFKRCLLINVLRQEENWRECFMSDVMAAHSISVRKDLSLFSNLLNNITIEDVISESKIVFSMQNVNYREFMT